LKKFVLIFFPLVALCLVAYIKYTQNLDLQEIDNKDGVAFDFQDNKIQCPQCYMYLVGKEHTAQAIDKENKTHFFDDPGCLILWARDQKIDINSLKLWVYAHDVKSYIDMREAFFRIDEKTPMEYGFKAYKELQDGSINFEEMRIKMLRGEHLLNPLIRKHILGA
jgi:hypothetical protein